MQRRAMLITRGFEAARSCYKEQSQPYSAAITAPIPTTRPAHAAQDLAVSIAAAPLKVDVDVALALLTVTLPAALVLPVAAAVPFE